MCRSTVKYRLVEEKDPKLKFERLWKRCISSTASGDSAGGGRQRSPRAGMVCYSVSLVVLGITFPRISGNLRFFARAEPKRNLGGESVPMNPHRISLAGEPVGGQPLPMADADIFIHDIGGSFFVSHGGSWVIGKT